MIISSGSGKTIVEDFSVAEPKTSLVAGQLNALGKTDVLIVTDEPDQSLVLGARNIPHVDITDPAGINPYSLLSHSEVVMTADAAKKLEGMFS